MNANEYQDNAMRTAAMKKPREIVLSTFALGLCGEAAELYDCPEDKRIKELGDCWWYVAALSRVGLDKNLADLIPAGLILSRTGAEKQLNKAAGLAADIVKKHVGHDHPLDVAGLAIQLHRYVEALMTLSNEINGGPEKVWITNVDKLKKRYPDGFSSEQSKNRSE